MEGFVGILLILTLSAISNWLINRRQQQEEEAQRREAGGEEHPLEHEQGEQRPRKLSWQEQLRRALEEHQTPPPPPLPPGERPQKATPPPVPKQAPEPPAAMARRASDHFQKAQEKVAQRARQMRPSDGQLMDKANALQKNVKSRTKGLFAQKSGGMMRRDPRMAEHKRTAQAAGLIQMLRSRDGAQKAIMASVVLGPPKSLSENSSPSHEPAA